MTVYVVTCGCYSDYRIDSMFSTREKAEQRLKDYFGSEKGGFDDSQIEEWELDTPGEKREFVTLHMVFRYLQSGETIREEVYPQLLEDFEREKQYREGRKVSEPNESAPWGYVEAVSTKSIEHARKLASEYRQAWFRENAARIPQVFADLQGRYEQSMLKAGKGYAIERH